MSAKTVVIIGAGVGGMSAAIVLARAGMRVTLIEKNRHLGGKLNLLETGGFKFDLGPSIFTLPHVFRPLFEREGRRLEDYIELRRVDPQWRNFFEDGTVLDLRERKEDMQAELARLTHDPTVFEEYSRFVDYSRQQYEVIERGYLRHGFDHFSEFLRFYGLREGRAMDWQHKMSGAIDSRVHNRYLRDILAYFAKYVGSSPNNSPGFMNLIPNIQLEFGLWYLQGGLYSLARAFERRLRELEVAIHTGCEALRIVTNGESVSSVAIRDRNDKLETIPADFVISNMEVVPTHKKLLGQTPQQLKSLRRFEPACSGIVLHLGLDHVYSQLAHHNFFYSRDQRTHFDRVFRQKRLPDDPTIYLVAPTRTDPSQAPPGCDNLKVLPHIPYINQRHPYTREDCLRLKELCLDKLERMGLANLRRHIVVEDFWTPFDIEERYASNCGAIYGVVCDRWKNFAFKAPKRSPDFKNLFFAGGSVNPGGGLPMVSLSGQHVARMILEQSQP